MPQQHTDALAITVVRSGGVAGIRRAWRVEAHGTEVREWIVLVEACPWEHTGTDTADTHADRFAWEVAAAAEGEDRRAVLAEQDLDGAWRELIERVRRDGSPCAADAP